MRTDTAEMRSAERAAESTIAIARTSSAIIRGLLPIAVIGVLAWLAYEYVLTAKPTPKAPPTTGIQASFPPLFVDAKASLERVADKRSAQLAAVELDGLRAHFRKLAANLTAVTGPARTDVADSMQGYLPQFRTWAATAMKASADEPDLATAIDRMLEQLGEFVK